MTELITAEQTRTTQRLTEIMVATTSYYLRTPLNSILNMHSLIENKIGDELALKWLKVSKQYTLLLQSLVNDTLDYFQIKN